MKFYEKIQFLLSGSESSRNFKKFYFFLITYTIKSIEISYPCVIFLSFLYQIIIIRKFAF